MLKYEYTQNNHFKFGYGSDHWYETRKSAEQVFQAQLGSVKNKNISWPESNQQAAIEIYERLPHPISILYSGGMDSEICIRSFQKAKLPFKAYSLRFLNQFNEHDIQYVQKFSKSNSIPIEYVDLDIEEFWNSSQFYKIIDPIQCVSPILACHLWLCDQVQGTPIIAQGEPHLKKEIPPGYVPGESPYVASDWYLVESERLCSLYLHFIFKSKPAVPGFFQYLPEQFYSYLTQNPHLENLIQNRLIGKLGTRTSKNLMIQQFYPDIEMRPKFTGFEKLEELHSKKRAELAERFSMSDTSFKISYSKLIKMLNP